MRENTVCPMRPDQKPNHYTKYITIILAAVIIFAVCVYFVTQFIPFESNDEDNHQESSEELGETVLSFQFDSEVLEYSLNDLSSMESITGKGSYINRIGTVEGPHDYTGVSILEFLSSIDTLPERYAVQAVASDDYIVNYTYEEVQGEVMIFDETGSELGLGSMTMAIAYQQDEEDITEENGGPLRIVFIDDEGSITQSGGWLQSLVQLIIIPADGSEEIILGISVGNDLMEYTLTDIMAMASFTGDGGYINRAGVVIGPDTYTGITITELLATFDDLPDDYTLKAIASDEYSLNYTYDEVYGEMTIFNDMGDELGVGSVTMLIAYQKNGEDLTDLTGGPIRIVFVDDEGSITRSSKWLQSLMQLTVVESEE